ncbi:MAG: hypothetical protein R3E87_18075 [Burkholderiaceae bacterium]
MRALGARGDGIADDTDAFQSASARINEAGGGTILIPPGRYRVGRQTLSGAIGQGASWRPEPIIRLAGCSRPVLVLGLGKHGTRPELCAADGLRFGSFDPISGLPAYPGLPFTNTDYRADAYAGMIELWRNADVRIVNLVLDGNASQLELGGLWGDAGYQCGASGLLCVANERVQACDLECRDHGLDGVMIANWDGDAALRPHVLERVVSTGNGRQALSWVGCSGLQARHCRFTRTGRGRIASAPGAALDIEPENTQMHTGLFEHCEFGDSVGVAVVSDSPAAGSSVTGVTFRHCAIDAGEQIAVLVRNDDFSFEHCRIDGCMAFNPAADLGVERIRFRDCVIHDRNPLAYRAGLLVDCSSGRPNLFEDCTFVVYRQRLGNLSQARVVRCVFVAALEEEFAATTDWILILYSARVERCEFRDMLPWRGGPLLLINISNETELIAPVLDPPDGRLRIVNQS